MNPYTYVNEYTKNGEHLLSLCCGIGIDIQNSKSKRIIGVDISEPYLKKLKERLPHVDTFKADALTFLKGMPTNRFDVVSMIDGLEHLKKEDALACLEEMKRVCKGHVLVFTQDEYVRNEPHNARDIEGSDESQRHLSENTIEEVTSHGYRVLETSNQVSQHGDYFKEVMYVYDKVK